MIKEIFDKIPWGLVALVVATDILVAVAIVLLVT